MKTLWYRQNPKTKEFEYNHSDTRKPDGDKPQAKLDENGKPYQAQAKSWKSGIWKKIEG